MKVRLATIDDFSEFKKYYLRTCYNWIYVSKKIEEVSLHRYEYMSSEELELEKKMLRTSELPYCGTQIGFIEKFVKYGEEDFATDLSSKTYKNKIYMIEQDGKVCGIFKLRRECSYLRILCWACDLELQQEENLKLMLELLTQEYEKKNKKPGLTYFIMQPGEYSSTILSSIGWTNKGRNFIKQL